MHEAQEQPTALPHRQHIKSDANGVDIMTCIQMKMTGAWNDSGTQKCKMDVGGRNVAQVWVHKVAKCREKTEDPLTDPNKNHTTYRRQFITHFNFETFFLQFQCLHRSVRPGWWEKWGPPTDMHCINGTKRVTAGVWGRHTITLTITVFTALNQLIIHNTFKPVNLRTCITCRHHTQRL